jgi:hypothetical protein
MADDPFGLFEPVAVSAVLELSEYNRLGCFLLHPLIVGTGPRCIPP